MIEELTLSSFLAGLRQRDIKLWLDGERLRVNAPAGTLTPALQAEIVRRKPDILALLKHADAAASTGPTLGPTARDRSLALSSSQQRLWFLDQFEPGNAAYNIPIALRLGGTLNVGVLCRSLEALLHRHEALRTRFTTLNGQPVQVVEPAAQLDVQHMDVGQFGQAERWPEALRLAGQIATRPFDLSQAPLMRAAVIRLSDVDHVLVLIVHHIAADAWSLGILGRELSTLYEAFLEGRPSPLADLAIQYADFAVWQQLSLSGERPRQQLGYWTRTLGGHLPALDIPADHPRPAQRSWRGARHCLTLDNDLLATIKDFSRAEGVTQFMVLLAAFQTLLHRTTHQDDIIVGTPVANRNQVETEAIVGFFVNSLVLRTDLSGEPTFRELLGRVRSVALDAFANQDVPFEKLVEVLQPDRDAGRLPLFSVLFSLQNVPLEEPRLANLTVEVIRSPVVHTARYDLTFELYERPHGLEVWIEYSTDLFEADTIERLSSQYESLLRSAVRAPEQSITALPLLTPAERQRLIADWNQTTVDFAREAGIHELFEAQARRTPEAVALVFENQNMTYGELNARANQLAYHLHHLGVGPETIVGVYLDRSIDMVVGLLGILKAGGAYLPLDPLFPTDRLAYMLEDSRALLLLTQTRLAQTLTGTTSRLMCLDDEWPRIVEQPTTNLGLPCTGDRLAYVLYTSGSTGRPKGVQIVQRGLMNFLTAMRERPGLGPSDILLSVTTLSFDIAGLELFLPLTTGARVVLVSSAVAADGAQLLSALHDSGATVMQATPATWRLLLAAGWRSTPHLRVLCGGEALSRELAGQLLARAGQVWNLYGPTETTIWSTLYEVTSVGKSSVPIGRPIANTQAYVLDARLQPVPIGVPGELYLGGDGLARGYLHQPELTATRFVSDPFAARPDARMYRTGDLVRYRSDGNLEYLERADTQVKVRGYRIELGEIESLLEQQSGVRQAVVIVREDVPGDKRLAGYLVLRDGSSAATDTLRSALRERLPTYMVPTTLTILEALPLTPNGKVDRKALSGVDTAVATSDHTYVAPRDDVERTLAQVWEDLLGHGPIGIRDNFFDVGGHSLLAARLVFRIQASLGRNLPVATLLHAATIEQLADILRAPEDSQLWDPLVQLQPGKPGRQPMFLVHGAFGDVLCYAELARALGADQPCYVLQAVGLDGVRAPQERVEDMAAEYIERMRTVQPSGPYCLAGYSIGGTIVYEMACQLEAAGDKVALLAVFDHPLAMGEFISPPSLPVFLARLSRSLVLNIPHWLRMAARVERGRWRAQLQERLRLARRAATTLVSKSPPTMDQVLHEVEQRNGLEHLAEWPEYRRRVLSFQFRAMETYQFRTYAGRLTLFRARRQPLVSAHDPVLGWDSAVGGGIDVVHVPGSHNSMLHEPYVQVLATGLRASLDALSLTA